VKFPCTSCGACCAKIQGEPWLSELPVRADGSCGNYDWKTKKCVIYETRPDICKVEKICPPGVPMKDHFTKVEADCDTVHRDVYGTERERDEDCSHKEAVIRLQLETTSTCNAGCGFCIYKTAGRAGGQMDMDLFRTIVDEAATIPSIKIYSLQGLGEPLLDRHIVERIEYIKEKDPACEIELFSNGVYVTPMKYDKLRDAGLDCLVISINAVSADQHFKIMELKDKFDIVVANAEYALANKGDKFVQVHATMDGTNFTEANARAFLEKWGDFRAGGDGKCVIAGNWAGDLEATEFPFKPNQCCNRAIDGIYVMYDGRISMCCFDPTGKTIFGDLKAQTLRGIYKDFRYVQFREDHFNDRADKWEQCKVCTRI